MKQSIDRRSAAFGAMLGVGAVGLLIVGLGAGAAMNTGEPIVTWGADGSKAYLWRISGDKLEFVSEARAEHGHGDAGAKDKDKDKPKDNDGGDDDDGNGNGNDKSKDKSKGKDKGNG